MAGQHLGIGGLQHAIGQREQMGVVFGELRAGAGGGGQRADTQAPVGVGRMAQQQSQDLSARITAGARDRYRCHP